MSSPESVLAQIDELIGMAEDATGQSFDNLTDAVAQLCEGYGTGSGDVSEEESCSHETTTVQYISAGNSQHTVKTVCSVCGEVVSEMAEACADETGGGLCDVCGAAVDTGGEEVCSHVNTTEETISNGNGSHTVKVTCTDCGTVISGTSVKCSPGVGNPTITSNGDGTHTSVTKCSGCEGIISEVIEPCEDTDGDGLCDVCGAAIDTGEEWNGEDYTGNLNGVHRSKFMVSGGKLVCQGATTTDYAVAAAGGTTSDEQTSGKSVLPIAIPEKASTITITFGDSGTTEVSILVFAGTVDAVTAQDTLNEEIVKDEPFSMDITPGMYQWVVFNAVGDYTGIYVNIATKVTVRFD